MKTLFISILTLTSIHAIARAKTPEQVFREHHVRVQKTEVLKGLKTYTVDLTIDPINGTNTHRLNQQLSGANNCTPYALVSSVDQVKIVVTTTKTKENCYIQENIVLMTK